MMMITVIQKQKPFGSCQFGKVGVLDNSIIQELKFCTIAQLFCVSFSGERTFERIERISFPKNSKNFFK
jgi:hypothetical protein